jgi:pimeloyl-ACP methyl ester carboxylesterase
MKHIARKGYVVVWVQYQRGILAIPHFFAKYALRTWRDALKRLANEVSHVRPEMDYRGEYKTAIVGHSLGGYLSAIIASKAARSWEKAPQPHAVVAVEPGGLGIIPEAPFDKIDPNTVLILVVGDEDEYVCKSTAVSIWNGISQIPDENKEFLLVLSDYHGTPDLVADHYFPAAVDLPVPEAENALDFYVTYKLSVGALNCAFRGTDCEYALGNGSFEQTDMGEWSDTTPVTPMLWVEEPNSLETTCQDP